MTEHELKTWPEYFQAIVENRKPFDYRLNDRDYQVGDVLHLREYVPPPLEYGEGSAHMRPTIVAEAGYYTGRSLRKSVTYILDDKIGPTMREGFVVMGLGEVDDPEPMDIAQFTDGAREALETQERDFKRAQISITNKARAERLAMWLHGLGKFPLKGRP